VSRSALEKISRSGRMPHLSWNPFFDLNQWANQLEIKWFRGVGSRPVARNLQSRHDFICLLSEKQVQIYPGDKIAFSAHSNLFNIKEDYLL